MNRTVSSYFDDAHRGLKRQQSAPHVLLSESPSNLQLPPLRHDVSPTPGSDPLADSLDKFGGSSLLGSLELSREQAALGIKAERYQEAMQATSKLSRRVRQLQDQLAITTAKKEAFKVQAQQLEKEFRRGREQSDVLQRELLEAKQQAAQQSKEAQEAIQMMTEMRKTHIYEVRLLQRGLAARGGDDKFRNKVNEVADLVDKLGRAIVSRDEALRDKTKLQAESAQGTRYLRSLAEDNARLRRQNKQLQESLKEAQRKAAFVPPRTPGAAGSRGQPEDSDDDFEQGLSMFEKRFQILEEGPAGLDILASNLSRDKQYLEKKLQAQKEVSRSQGGIIENWKALCSEKDAEVQELNSSLEKMMRDQAQLQEQIAQKRHEIELQVAEERAALERRISELVGECDDARAAADGMEKASSRLTQELLKVHQQYTGPAGVPPEGGPGGGEAEAAGGVAEEPLGPSEKSPDGEGSPG